MRSFTIPKSIVSEFAEVLMGDAGYIEADTNRVALENMLVGWLRGSSQWNRHHAEILKEHPRSEGTDEYLIARLVASEAVDVWMQKNPHGRYA